MTTASSKITDRRGIGSPEGGAMAEKEDGRKTVSPDGQGTKPRQEVSRGSRKIGTPVKERKENADGVSPVTSRTPDASASLSAKLGGMALTEKEAQGEGDWKHARNNGPWQFDFNVLILKDYDGKTRPSEMIFDTVDVWVRVEDLPLDKRTKEFGEVLGNWLGEVVKVDVESDGFAKGKYLIVRVKISVYEPLVRYFNLKESKEDDEGTWFNFSYEKIPHFCFECGRLVHAEGKCDPPVDKSAQWGEWLRASPGRISIGKGGGYGGAASSSFSGESSRTGASDPIRFPSARVRDLPTKRNIQKELSQASYSHTGEGVQ
ncbi:hypothetical protein D1007_26835 [Hordeum vulgare]|nr:hypothetical protein D1007_26835 [Hordeum vulgare]